MFVKKSSGTTSFGVFSTIILLELLIRDRFALGMHLHRHSLHKHRGPFSDATNAIIPAYVEANELGDFKPEDPENVVLEDFGAEEVPEEHRQAQPEDFIFLPDLYDGSRGTHGSLVNIESNELQRSENAKNREEGSTLEKENGPGSATAVSPNGSVPDLPTRHIIDAPIIVPGCKVGERRDSIGKCRLVLMK